MVVRNFWSLAACACLVGSLACHKSGPSASSIPVITSFTPAQGLTGSTLVLTGSGFTGMTNVSVGGATADASVDSDNQITLTVPLAAQTGIIGVVNGYGSGGSTSNFDVIPTITAISPTTGAPGTTVTITGTGLTGTKLITFGTGPAAFFYVNFANQAQAVVPYGSTTGPVTVTASFGATATSGTFTYTGGAATAPTLNFPATQAHAGDTLALVGSGFLGVSAVKLGGVVAAFTANSDTSMSVQVPTNAASGAVELDSFLGNVTAPGFTVIPTLTGFSPSSGAPGTAVALTGTGFVGATRVAFGNGTLSNFIVYDANTAQANVAAGSLTGPISITSSGLVAQSASSFTFEALTTGPVLQSFLPTSAAAGQTVTLTGSGFTGVSAISVGGAAIDAFTVASDTQITFGVPQDAVSGYFALTNPLGAGGIVSSAAVQMFTVTPVITDLTPASGPVGTTVTLTGSGFVGTSSITVAGTPAANFAVADANTVTFQIPAGAATGIIQLTTSTGANCTSTGTFTVTQ